MKLHEVKEWTLFIHRKMLYTKIQDLFDKEGKVVACEAVPLGDALENGSILNGCTNHILNAKDDVDPMILIPRSNNGSP